MKRIILAIAAAVAVQASLMAQEPGVYNSQYLGRTTYFGTARSIALGGAMTALGGDLGSVTYNPAGSAVNYYSQFTITPDVSVAMVNSAYDPLGDGNYGPWQRGTRKAFKLPNIGLNLVMDAHDSDWITAMSFGVIANSTDSYLGKSVAGGSNGTTSFLGHLAAAASHFPDESYLKAAYKAGQFDSFGPDGSYGYIASNEFLPASGKYPYTPAPLNQTAVFEEKGHKTDLIFNLGFNVSDAFYFGFNLGTPMLRYRADQIFTESSGENIMAFPIGFGDEGSTFYKESENCLETTIKANGIFGAFGFIWLPTKHLRLGASIKTPTLYSVTATADSFASIEFQNSQFNGSASDGPVEWFYNVTTPYVVNAGLAYTLPGVGLLSVDYELSDYSVMRYSESEDYYRSYSDPYWEVNRMNKLFLGVSHSLRAGIEAKPVPALAIRAGYSFTTCPEKWYNDNNGNVVNSGNYNDEPLKKGTYYNELTHCFSTGFGYSSPDSFFADFALRLCSSPASGYYPYVYGAYTPYDSNGNQLAASEPSVRMKRSVIDAVVTFGWRF